MHRIEAGRPRGAMINGCVTLLGVLIVVVTLGGKLAGFPQFHVVVATITLMFAMILSRTPGTRWQVEALAAVGAPAVAATAYAYATQPDFEALQADSGLLYIVGAGVFVVSCIVRARRASPIEVEGEN